MDLIRLAGAQHGVSQGVSPFSHIFAGKTIRTRSKADYSSGLFYDRAHLPRVIANVVKRSRKNNAGLVFSGLRLRLRLIAMTSGGM
jgi:hypothetical protein